MLNPIGVPMVRMSLVRVALAALFLTAPWRASAGTGPVHNVTSDDYYSTIQPAIIEALDGQLIVVEPGEYLEQINFLGKDITVRSSNPNNPAVVAATIIDGDLDGDGAEGEGPTVTFENGETRAAALAGFTITGGSGKDDPTDGWNPDTGGGIYCLQASPTIRQNVVTANHADLGGGAYFHGGNALFERNWVRGNVAEHSGGGLKAYASSVEIRDNLITGNRAEESDGGGIDVYDCPPGVVIRHNTFAGNYSVTGGSAVSCDTASPTVNHNIAVANRRRPAVYVYAGSSPVICFNDVWSNPAGNYGGEAAPGGQAVPCPSGEISADPLFVTAGMWTDPNGTPGNLNDDVWSEGDYHLQSGSPCVGAGDSLVPPNGETDYEGQPRLMSCYVDIGADEYLPSPAVLPAVVYVDTDAAGSADGSSWLNAYTHLQDALASAAVTPCRPLEIWVAEGTYMPDGGSMPPGGPFTPGTGDRTATFGLLDGVAPYGGFEGDETSIDQRDVDSNATILAGDLLGNDGPYFTNYGDNAYHVVTANATCASAVLDGFTVTAGRLGNSPPPPAYGSGVLGINNAIPAIRNCTVKANDGGGIADCDGTIQNCKITDNREGRGGGLYLCDGYIQDCVVARNSGFSSQGAIRACHGTIRRCTVEDNAFPDGAGGLYNCDGLITQCVITRNRSEESGGLGGCDGVVESCYILQNETGAQTGAGGVGGGNVNALLWRCVIVGNDAEYGTGGGLHSFHGTVRDCLIAYNTASYGGGVGGGSANVINCKILGNTSLNGVGGGGIYACTGPIRNSLIWGNNTSGQAGAPQISESSVPSYCRIQDWRGGGAGNSGALPPLTPDGHLRADSALIGAGNPNEVIDSAALFDIDGDERIGDGLIDIGPDEFIDSDGDGLPDWWEVVYPAAGDPDVDSDSDGLTNLKEYDEYSISNPLAPPLYVDGTAGNDAWNGASEDYNPATGDGPKRTIQAAVDVAVDGDTVIVAPGDYMSPGFSGKSVVVRAMHGPGVTRIDGQGRGAPVDSVTSVGSLAIVEGFTLVGQSIGGRPMLKNCSVGEGAFLFGSRIMTIFDEVVLSSGLASTVADSQLQLDGPVVISDGSLTIESSWLYGEGWIEVARGAHIEIGGAPGGSPTGSQSGIRGTGEVHIAAGSTLRIEHGAVVDMGEVPGAPCNPADAPNWGRIVADGLLLVRDATIRSTNVSVNLLGNLEGDTTIHNNDIRLASDNVTGWGGEFFIEGSSEIRCNVITSDGDRYLDLDPDPDDGVMPIIEGNKFNVIIKQGVGGLQGELLELRSPDYDNAVSNGVSGAYELASSQGYDDTWALERLEILPGAKVNLTNRQGFDFNPNDPIDDTVYVKDLIIGTNGVLNTGLQRLYYQNLIMGPGAEIVDIPVLGFSLKVIAMEDSTEFSVRVRQRISDPIDVQDCRCDGVCPNNIPPQDVTTCKEGAIARIDVPTFAGVMDMRAQADNRQSASSVAAKGAFARAGEDEIVVAFEYLFVQNPTAELIVYLSDTPDASPAGCDSNGCCDDDRCEVARVQIPDAGRDGASTALGGTGEFATFYGKFPRGNLNFTRGTYVELELRGADSRVWIDDWDPQIDCAGGCGDLNGSNAFESLDFFVLLAAFGSDLHELLRQGQPRFCLDSVLGGDMYVDLADLLAWDGATNDPLLQPRACNPSVRPAPPGGAGGSLALPGCSGLSLPEGLVVAGKPGGSGQADMLYALDPNGSFSTSSPVPTGQARGHGRIAYGPDGTLHQLHASLGLVRYTDSGCGVVVPPSAKPFNGATVHVGVVPALNCFCDEVVAPLADFAFDPMDPNVVYVVPVLVTPAGATAAHKAAAKLVLEEGDGYSVQTVYEPPGPFITDCNPDYYSTNGCGAIPNSDYTQFREIEVSADGSRVFIASAQALNANDWLLVYDTNGVEQERIELADLAGFPLPAPTAMTVSADGDWLYLTSGIPAGVGSSARVFRFDTSGASVAFAGKVDVANPSCNDPFMWGCLSSVTALAAEPDGTLWAAGFTRPNIPGNLSIESAEYQQLLGPGAALFTTPTLARIPVTIWNPPSGASVDADPLDTGTNGLALPISLAWNAGPCPIPGDLDHDGDVDLADWASFRSCITGPMGTAGAGCDCADFDSDADVDLKDYAAFQVAM